MRETAGTMAYRWYSSSSTSAEVESTLLSDLSRLMLGFSGREPPPSDSSPGSDGAGLRLLLVNSLLDRFRLAITDFILRFSKMDSVPPKLCDSTSNVILFSSSTEWLLFLESRAPPPPRDDCDLVFLGVEFSSDSKLSLTSEPSISVSPKLDSETGRLRRNSGIAPELPMADEQPSPNRRGGPPRPNVLFSFSESSSKSRGWISSSSSRISSSLSTSGSACLSTRLS